MTARTSLADYSIRHGSTLHAFPLGPSEIAITFKGSVDAETGQESVLDLLRQRDYDTEVAALDGIEIWIRGYVTGFDKPQFFVFQGRTMDRDRLFIEFAAEDGCMEIYAFNDAASSQLAAPAAPLAVLPSVTLSVETLFGNTFTIRVKLSDTVVKSKPRFITPKAFLSTSSALFSHLTSSLKTNAP